MTTQYPGYDTVDLPYKLSAACFTLSVCPRPNAQQAFETYNLEQGQPNRVHDGQGNLIFYARHGTFWPGSSGPPPGHNGYPMPPLLPWTVDQSYYVTGHAPLGTPQIPQPHVQIPFGIAPSGQHVGLSADALPFVPGLVSHNANAHAPPPRAGPLRGQPALNGTSAPNPKQGQGLGSQSVGDTNGPADGASGLNGLAAPFLLQGQGSGAERGVSGLNGSAAPFNRERQDSDSADSSAAGSRGRPVSATAIDTPQSSPPKSIRKDSQEDLNEEEPVQASSSGTLLAKSDAGVPLGHSATFPQVNNPLSRGAVAEEREAFTQFHDRLEIFYRNVAAEPERQWRRNFHPRDADDMLTEQLASIVGASG